MSVTISDRTRKILWAKAGGRCSICRELLVTEGTDADDPSVFGQEAHIIAEAPNGPRHADLPEYDVYENLILLCSKHHKKVDDQVVYYTTAMLKEVKRDHENWVVSLGDRARWLLPEPGYLFIRGQDGDPTSRLVIPAPEGEDVGCWITQPSPGTPFWFRAGPGRNFDTVGQLACGQRVYGSREGVMREGTTWYLLRRNDKDWAWGNGKFLRPVTGDPSIARPAVGDTQPPSDLPGHAFISYVREDAQQVGSNARDPGTGRDQDLA